MIKNILCKKVTVKHPSVKFAQNDGIYHIKSHFLPQKMTDLTKKRGSFPILSFKKDLQSFIDIFITYSIKSSYFNRKKRKTVKFLTLLTFRQKV